MGHLGTVGKIKKEVMGRHKNLDSGTRNEDSPFSPGFSDRDNF